MDGTVVIVFLIALALVIFVIAVTGMRIISPYEKGVVERLGRYYRTAQPGLTIIVPFLDTLRKVDMREQVVDVQPQEVITKDNVVVTVDAIIYYEATDPVKLTYNVVDFYNAATKLAQTNLRNVVGETELDQALTSRDMINMRLREVLDDATDKWGVRIVRVEIKRIDPPVDVTQAMHRQMKAEREKRAQILEAEGLRQSRILRADGEAEALRRVADAQRYKLEVEAAGQSNAITMVYSSITNANPDDRLIAIQYLDALKGIANGQATKIFLPYEASSLLGALGGIQEIFREHPGGGPPANGNGVDRSLSLSPPTPPALPASPTPPPPAEPA
jgi:regulator of protease activity HflC (stomatin/prohibitin superfamily)